MKKLLLTANHKFILVNVLFDIALLATSSRANAVTYCNPTYPNSGNTYGFSNITIGTINDNPNSTWSTHDKTATSFNATAGNTAIKLFDNLGKVLVNQEKTTTKGVNFWNISTSDLPNEIYFLQIQNKDNEVIKLEIAH